MRIDYDGRRFCPAGPDAEHESGRVAQYRQQQDLLWGEFSGGQARRGSLTGTCSEDGVLDFAYCLVLDSGEIISGRCHSTPTMLPDGRIRLDEQWQRFEPHAASGTSALEEVLLPSTQTAQELA
jgi:hypothetical protein